MYNYYKTGGEIKIREKLYDELNKKISNQFNTFLYITDLQNYLTPHRRISNLIQSQIYDEFVQNPFSEYRVFPIVSGD